MDTERTYGVTVICQGCLGWFTFYTTEEDYHDWLNGGVHVQEAFPYLSEDELELLISNTCGVCWEETLPPEEEDWYPEDEYYESDPLENSDLWEYERDWYVD